ncbi:hypothetical protein ILUMI_07786 [Ignelater luminosus]|uniref:RING-type domain-containing protein n=1 Tax=Ignelater luminosus TaxID=2038154 RepID=A0A8K0D839_IGNLU|nr:hypothetical protein ILUMI_07786 [Ignelater luminosus]
MDSYKMNRKRKFSEHSIASRKDTECRTSSADLTFINPRGPQLERGLLDSLLYENRAISVEGEDASSAPKRRRKGIKRKPSRKVCPTPTNSNTSQHDNNDEDSDCCIVEWKSFPCALHPIITDPPLLKNVNPNETGRSDQPLSNSKTKLTNPNQDATCTICLKSLNGKKISSTICGHVFCTACITDVVKLLQYCPICRKPLNLSKIHPLYI